jgi:hypothetical protein
LQWEIWLSRHLSWDPRFSNQLSWEIRLHNFRLNELYVYSTMYTLCHGWAFSRFFYSASQFGRAWLSKIAIPSKSMDIFNLLCNSFVNIFSPNTICSLLKYKSKRRQYFDVVISYHWEVYTPLFPPPVTRSNKTVTVITNSRV